MRAYIQLIAMIGAMAGCGGAIDCCNDYTPPTYAVADVTILEPAGAQASRQTVTVTSRDPARCSDTLPKSARFLAAFTTGTNGRAVASMTITPFLMSAVDACVSIVVEGGTLFRDTTVADFDVRFRQAGAAIDTVRATIKLTAK